VPWGLFLRSAPVWAIIVAHFCYNWGYYTLLAWLPSYFELSLGLSVEGSSLLTLIPYVSMTAMTPFVGPVADALVARGWSITRVRKLAQVGTPPPAGCPQGGADPEHCFFHRCYSKLGSCNSLLPCKHAPTCLCVRSADGGCVGPRAASRVSTG
jgi:hypothetical protein